MSQSATATFHPNATSLAIMKLIHGYFCKTKKPWNLISQEWILARLKEWYDVDISRSALNYNLAILRKNKIIETTTRHKRDEKTGEFVCQVTLYKRTAGLRKCFSALAGYFKRCGWVPNVKRLAFGMIPVVGAVTTPEESLKHMLEERRRKSPFAPKRKKGR